MAQTGAADFVPCPISSDTRQRRAGSRGSAFIAADPEDRHNRVRLVFLTLKKRRLAASESFSLFSTRIHLDTPSALHVRAEALVDSTYCQDDLPGDGWPKIGPLPADALQASLPGMECGMAHIVPSLDVPCHRFPARPTRLQVEPDRTATPRNRIFLFSRRLTIQFKSKDGTFLGLCHTRWRLQGAADL